MKQAIIIVIVMICAAMMSGCLNATTIGEPPDEPTVARQPTPVKDDERGYRVPPASGHMEFEYPVECTFDQSYHPLAPSFPAKDVPEFSLTLYEDKTCDAVNLAGVPTTLLWVETQHPIDEMHYMITYIEGHEFDYLTDDEWTYTYDYPAAIMIYSNMTAVCFMDRIWYKGTWE